MKNINLICITTIISSILPLQSADGAVNLSSSETGQAIIVPFYTVSNKMNTSLSLNNTTDESKAVKIHFKEAKSSDILTSFNVYLTAHDMWTMTTGQINGQIKMISNDQSCTIGFPNNLQDIPVDEDWLWENGTIEIIEMGVVAPINNTNPEMNCQSIRENWQQDQKWSLNSETEMSAATGGLHAEVTLMNVDHGYSANIPVIHMDNFYAEDDIQHTPAGDSRPNLSSGTKDSLVIVDGKAITTTWPTGYEAVSALLMKHTLTNEHNTEPGVLAQTEFIFSFPTLFYHLNNENGTKPFSTFELIQFDTEVFHFVQSAHAFNRNSEYLYLLDNTGCVSTLSPKFLSHSVANLTPNFYIPFFDPSSYEPYEYMLTNRSQKNTRALLHYDYAGKYRLNLSEEYFIGQDPMNPEIKHAYHGLPVVGFSFMKFTNVNAQPGLMAQYAFVSEHFGDRKVEIEPVLPIINKSSSPITCR